MILAIVFGALWVITSYVSFILLKKLNKYIVSLETKIEENLVVTENLKQSFRDCLFDATFLLDDGKLKPLPMQKEKGAVINGVQIEEQNTQF